MSTPRLKKKRDRPPYSEIGPALTTTISSYVSLAPIKRNISNPATRLIAPSPEFLKKKQNQKLQKQNIRRFTLFCASLIGIGTIGYKIMRTAKKP